MEREILELFPGKVTASMRVVNHVHGYMPMDFYEKVQAYFDTEPKRQHNAINGFYVIHDDDDRGCGPTLAKVHNGTVGLIFASARLEDL